MATKRPSKEVAKLDESGLSARMRISAFLEATGILSRDEIASQMEVSPTTVSRWRNEKVYQEEIAHWAEIERRKFDNLISRYKFEVFDGARKAIESAIKDLDDNDDLVRRQAREQLLQLARGLIETAGKVEEGRAIGGSGRVTIYVGERPTEVLEGEVNE